MDEEQKRIVDSLRDFDYACSINNVTKEMCDRVILGEAADMIEHMAAELEQIKRERDAAIYDIREMAQCLDGTTAYACAWCKYLERDSCNGIGCGDENDDFEWRGVCAENATYMANQANRRFLDYGGR